MKPARDLLDRYAADPVAFMREVLRFQPWSKQTEIMESVRDHPRTAVRSCHGPGKTATAARVALWFLAVHEGAKVITTAPTALQVRGQLWREIRAAHRDSHGFIGGELHSTRLDLGEEWFMVGFATDEAERFAGWHSEHLLLVCDEASGIPEEIYEAAAGLLTTEGARELLIGNPTRTSGHFFNAFHNARDLYSTIAISAFETPAFTRERVPDAVRRRLVTRRWVETMTRKWGEGSPLWQVRIAADFPSESDDVVVALGDLEGAQRRELEPGLPLIVACDVARFGSDQTVLAVRRGNVVRIAKAYGGRDTMRTAGEITVLARSLQAQHGYRPTLVVDDAGVGGGVTDRLRELAEFPDVRDFNAARAATRQADYPNKRSESWFDLAEALPLIDLDDDEELAADLLAPRYALDSQGRRVVELKSETKRRLRRSPDRADAVVMALSVEPPARRGRHATMSVPTGRARPPKVLTMREVGERELPLPEAEAVGEFAKERLAAMRARAGVPMTTEWHPELRS